MRRIDDTSRRAYRCHVAVDGEAQQVEVWTPEDTFPRLERGQLVWQPEQAIAPFTLALEELFRASA